MQVQTLSQQKYGAEKNSGFLCVGPLGSGRKWISMRGHSMRLKIVDSGSFRENSFKNKQEPSGSFQLCRYSY